MGKPFPLISGTSRLVKYYDLARFFKRWQLFDIHIFGEIIFFNYDLRHATTKNLVFLYQNTSVFVQYGPIC